VRVGIVGLGRWARVLTRISTFSDRIEIVTVCGRSEGKREAFQADPGLLSVLSPEVTLARDYIDGVILTVPNEQHYTVALEVAKAGQACLHREADGP
jgi:predicted dehydrogenase